MRVMYLYILYILFTVFFYLAVFILKMQSTNVFFNKLDDLEDLRKMYIVYVIK